MQQLFLLMVSQFLVTFVTSDKAVTISRGLNYLYLTKDNLNMMHACLCSTSHSSCTFDFRKQSLTYSQVSQSYSSTEYLNGYICSFISASINCKRMIHNDHQAAAIKHVGKSISLHGIKTPDINCVDVVWNDTVSNITINKDVVSDKLCPATPPCSTKKVTNTKLIIIIAAESSILVVFIISVIIAVCVRIKRKRQVQKTTIDTTNLDNVDYLEVYNSGGLNAVSTDTSSLPCMDLLQEPHYQEIEEDRPDPHQPGETLSKI